MRAAGRWANAENGLRKSSVMGGGGGEWGVGGAC